MFLVIWLSCTLPCISAIYDGQVSTYELLYGDLTNLENDFVLPVNFSGNTDKEEPKPKSKRSLVNELLKQLDQVDQIHASEHRYDIEDFNKINRELKNLTRRQYERLRYPFDEDDYYDRAVNERTKKMMLLGLNLQFLIHARRKIAIAIRLRNFVRKDKRYRLGYMFSRLRRLVYNQRKMVFTAEWNRNQRYYTNLLTQIRLYERVVRLDIDIRDTCNLIKSVYAERAGIDMVY